MVEKNDIQNLHVVELTSREITLFCYFQITKLFCPNMLSKNGSAVAYIDLTSTIKYCIPVLS